MPEKHVCKIFTTEVTDSRPVREFEKYGRIRRRRQCLRCGLRVTTIEKAAPLDTMIEVPVKEYQQLKEAREFVAKLASFAETLKENGTSSTTV